MGECKNLLDMANNVANQIFKRSLSQNVAPSAANEALNFKILQKFNLAWLLSYAPAFYINSKQVKILHEPQSFYKLILQEIKRAKKRIVLASLYLGTGPLEENLVNALKKRLEEQPNLKVKILLDCTRGSRGDSNSRKMVLPLLKDHKQSCQVSLFQTANNKSSLIPFLPTKYKEIIGLQHIKVYLFDDNFIVTGANLSSDYFTQRQDRYMYISNSQEISDFIEGLVDKVSEFSFQLDAQDNLSLSKNWGLHPSKTDTKTFNFAASVLIKNYYEKFLDRENSEGDTVIFPLLEMGPFNIHVDSTITKTILEKCNESNNVYLTTGYFNLTQGYIHTIINKSNANYKILMAHPMANGFYKAKGLAGGIPHAYTKIALMFLEKIKSSKQSFRIQMFEYKRPGWTYHAKGLWLSSLNFKLPFLTMIGSPNFGERSINHDLECQFMIVTTNQELQSDFLRERELLYDSCMIEPFTKATCSESDRITPFWVKVVVWLFRTYL